MATTTYIRAHAQTKTTSIHAPILYKSAPPIVLHEEASLSSLIMPEDEYEDLIDDSVFLEAAHSSELLTPKRKSRATSHTFIEESIQQQQQQQQQQQHRTASHKSPFKLPTLPHLGGSHHDR